MNHNNSCKSLTTYQSEYFDFFRGLSAVLVLLSHICQIFWNKYFQDEMLNSIVNAISGIAVMVFFVLSGFLISTTIYRNLVKNNFKCFDSKRFIIDRLVRLYPPLLFTFILMCLIYFVSMQMGLEGARMTIEWNNLIGSMFFLQNFYSYIQIPLMNGPLWSLSWEFWYYIFALLLVLTIKKSWHYFFYLILLFVLAAYSLRGLEFFSGLVVWCSGSLAFFLYQLGWGSKKYHQMLTLVALSIGLGISYFFFTTDIQSNIFTGGKKYVAGLTFSLIIVWILIQKKEASFIQKNILFRFFKRSSSYSYTLYIVHFPILYFIYLAFNMSGMTDVQLMFMSVISMFFSILFSAFFSRFLEAKEVLNSIKKFINRFSILT